MNRFGGNKKRKKTEGHGFWIEKMAITISWLAGRLFTRSFCAVWIYVATIFFTLSQVSYVTAKKFSIVLGCSTSITTTKTWFLDDMVVCWYGAVVDGDQVEMTT